MNHRNGFNPLSRMVAHQRAMSRNMVTSLLRYERITTTQAKALEVRKAAEKIITRAKEDSVHNRRQVAKFVQDKIILAKLFTNIGPRMKDRAGGYTRILKLGFRAGDAANIVILELTDYEFKNKNEEKNASVKKIIPTKLKNTVSEKTGKNHGKRISKAFIVDKSKSAKGTGMKALRSPKALTNDEQSVAVSSAEQE